MNSNKSHKPIRKGNLTKKVVIILILLGTLIAITSIIVGFTRFTKVIQEMYFNEATQIGNIVSDYVDIEEISSLIDKIESTSNKETRNQLIKETVKSTSYRNLIRFLDDLRRDLNVTDIFIASFKNAQGEISSEGTYIAGVSGLRLDPRVFIIGEPIDNPEAFEIIESIYNYPVIPDKYLRVDTADGPAMSAFIPLVNRDGQTVAVIGVQEPMTKLFSARYDFIAYVIFYSVIITAIVIIGFVYLNKKVLITPIKKITNAASGFVKNNITMSDELDSINTNDELEVLANSFKQMEKDINNYIDNLQEVTTERERVQAELNIATEIQKNMLPNIFPPFPDRKEFEIYATMEPAKEVGGDFYDLFLIDEDHLGFVIADVSGKGVPAALFMVIAKTLIKDHALSGESPSEVFTNVNNLLCESNGADMFVTAWLGILEISTGKLTYVNAGHNPPVIKRGNESFKYLKQRPGLVLAGMDGMFYREAEINLKPGDKIYLYTDGVTEAQNINDELYGENRLERALNQNLNADVNDLLKNIRKDIDNFVKEAPQFDDITMVGLEYLSKDNKK